MITQCTKLEIESKMLSERNEMHIFKKIFAVGLIACGAMKLSIAEDNQMVDKHKILSDEFNHSMGFNRTTFRKERETKYKHPLTGWCREHFIKNQLLNMQPQTNRYNY